MAAMREISVSLDDGTRAALAAEAHRQRRPMSSLVRLVLEDWIAARGEFDASLAAAHVLPAATRPPRRRAP